MTLMMHQHMSSFSKVKEIYENDYAKFSGYRSLAMIVPAVSGHRHRYHVYRLDFERGDLVMIGNELPIDWARAVARRSRVRDWSPVTDADLKIGRMSPRSKHRWEQYHRPYKGPRKRIS